MTKLFQVTTEHTEGDSNEIHETIQYVIADNDSLKLVVDYFTVHCEQYEMDLKGVREVLSIVQHIREEK